MTASSPPKSYVSALKLILRPLVRGLISQGMTLPNMNALLKQVYVEAAEDFRISSKRLTDSRISLLTGVHRKDVKRIRETERSTPALSPKADIGAQVVALWTGDPEFLDGHGRPRPLPRSGEHSFDTLVQSISRDMRPRTLLDEWLRREIVVIDDNDHIVLNSAAFVPSDDYDDLAFYFGRNLHDHLSTAVHNLERPDHPLLERATYYDGLSPQSVSELEKLSRTIGMDALVQLNKRAHQLVKVDQGKENANLHFNFGLYFYRSDVALPPADDTPSKTDDEGDGK